MNTVLKATQDQLYAEHKVWTSILAKYPKLPNGLTPDNVRADPEWKAVKHQVDKSFARIRAFNCQYAKQLRKSA